MAKARKLIALGFSLALSVGLLELAARAVYQPDWEGRGEDGISDGYPRFGTKEKEQFAAFFDAKSYKTKLEFTRLNLELGATTLLVGCAATLALLY